MLSHELKTDAGRRTPTALVVEPAPAMARLLGTMMRNLGYQVIEACGPDEAITEVETRSTEIDLVLSELSLPEVSGPKLASYILKRRPSIPIVLLCDNGLPAAVSSPPAVLLRKPFTSDQLAAAIQGKTADRAS